MTTRPPIWPFVALGVGLGGFVDGIVFHQILQWHHMLTAEGCCPADTVLGLEDNTLADGFFHLAAWIAVLAGTVGVTRAWHRRELAPPWRAHLGAALAGWGGFNLLEGLVDHHILAIHHVRDDIGGPLGWDLAFLGFGALLVLAGAAMIASARRNGDGSGEHRGAGPQPRSAGRTELS